MRLFHQLIAFGLLLGLPLAFELPNRKPATSKTPPSISANDTMSIPPG